MCRDGWATSILNCAVSKKRKKKRKDTRTGLTFRKKKRKRGGFAVVEVLDVPRS